MRWPGPTDPPASPGRLVRLAREDAVLSQAELAEQAGLSRSVVTRFESGARGASWPVFERLLGAMGLQPRVALEPTDEHLRRELADEADRPEGDWVYDLGADLYGIPALTVHFPVVVDGSLAARLHGLPMPVHDVELVGVRPGCDRDEVAEACARWSLWPREAPDEDTLVLAGDGRRVVLRLVDDAPPHVVVTSPWRRRRRPGWWP